MKYKFLPLFIPIFILVSCNNGETSPKVEAEYIQTVSNETSFANLPHNNTNVPQELSNVSIGLEWKNLSELEGTWTKLEKDKEGFLVYNPLNGSTPRIVVKNGEITIFWWLDGPTTFKIQKAAISKDGKVISFEGLMIDGPSAVFNCNLKDAANHRVSWSFTIYNSISQGGTANYDWSTTRREMEHMFRFVDQKNAPSGGKERTFLTSPFN